MILLIIILVVIETFPRSIEYLEKKMNFSKFFQIFQLLYYLNILLPCRQKKKKMYLHHVFNAEIAINNKY